MERDFTATFRSPHTRLSNHLGVKKTDGNTFTSALRLFRVPATAQLGFPSIQALRNQCGQCITALYIFRLHHSHRDGYTHGVHLRLNGYAHRRYFEGFLEELVRQFTTAELDLKSVVPVIKKSVSLYDYLQSLYVVPVNLLVNFSHHLDAVAANQKQTSRVDTTANTVLKNKMQKLTSTIMDTMIAMPDKYPTSTLAETLALNEEEFKLLMRSTNINDFVLKVAQDAYSFALQDRQFRDKDIQELMQPMTRRSMLNHCVSTHATKQIQCLFQQTFVEAFVHPHPFNGIVKSDLFSLPPLDGLVFDPRFLFNVLLTSRWFVRACMRNETVTTNNHAHLLLYGGAGTGKTLLVSAIASSVATYKYLVSSRFQNPDMLRSSLLSIDEFDTSSLPSNSYKQLLDLKTHVKVDFKNLNPENVTEGVPCMLTTNDEVYSVLRTQKKFNASSVAAAIRRLYVIPVKAGSFDKLHGRIPGTSPYYASLTEFDTRFERETNKLQRIFNLIFSFALFQQDIAGLYFDQRLHNYYLKLIKDFSKTAFGTFYLSQKAEIDGIIQEVEHTMMEQDSDDHAYLVKVSTCAGQFQQLLYQFLGRMVDKTELNPAIINEKTLPWPVKAYYLSSSMKFHVKLMWEVTDAEKFLNQEVRDFINNPHIQPFRTSFASNTAPEDEPYGDLRQPCDSSEEGRDPFDHASIMHEEQKQEATRKEFEEIAEKLGEPVPQTFAQMCGLEDEEGSYIHPRVNYCSDNEN